MCDHCLLICLSCFLRCLTICLMIVDHFSDDVRPLALMMLDHLLLKMLDHCCLMFCFGVVRAALVGPPRHIQYNSLPHVHVYMYLYVYYVHAICTLFLLCFSMVATTVFFNRGPPMWCINLSRYSMTPHSRESSRLWLEKCNNMTNSTLMHNKC
jgi:hypothetical protein